MIHWLGKRHKLLKIDLSTLRHSGQVRVSLCLQGTPSHGGSRFSSKSPVEEVRWCSLCFLKNTYFQLVGWVFHYPHTEQIRCDRNWSVRPYVCFSLVTEVARFLCPKHPNATIEVWVRLRSSVNRTVQGCFHPTLTNSKSRALTVSCKRSF